jgi:multidrug efflux pump subunit AcrB
MIPLSSVVKMHTFGETVEMDRERMRPVVRVTARVEGTDLGTAIANVKSSVASVALPPGVTVEYGGLYADQQTAFRQLELVLFTSIAAMFLVLIWEFRRVAPALSVLISALSCIVGSFILLRVTGMTMNISSFMGVIMVAGITAKNGILLLDHATRSMEEGEEARAALVEAAQIRLRPILMTTLATAAGLLPLALGLGAGARIQQPLALAVIGGLAFALLLSTPFGAGLYLSSVRWAGTTAGIRKPVG